MGLSVARYGLERTARSFANSAALIPVFAAAAAVQEVVVGGMALPPVAEVAGNMMLPGAALHMKTHACQMTGRVLAAVSVMADSRQMCPVVVVAHNRPLEVHFQYKSSPCHSGPHSQSKVYLGTCSISEERHICLTYTHLPSALLASGRSIGQL